MLAGQSNYRTYCAPKGAVMTEVQPSRVGRRLLAILAADVAGYSRLMGLDEEATCLMFGMPSRRRASSRDAAMSDAF